MSISIKAIKSLSYGRNDTKKAIHYIIYYGNIDYADRTNGDLIYTMHGLGRVKLWQGSVGIGYAYNWVPVKGLLVSAMAMPMLTFINKIKAYGQFNNMRYRHENSHGHLNDWFVNTSIGLRL